MSLGLFPILFMTGLPGSGKTHLAGQISRSWNGAGLVDSDDPGYPTDTWSCRSSWVIETALARARSSPVVATLLRWELITGRMPEGQLFALVWLDTPIVDCIARQPKAYRGLVESGCCNFYSVPAFTFNPPPAGIATRITDVASFNVQDLNFQVVM